MRHIKPIIAAAIAALLSGPTNAAKLRVFPVTIDAETPRATINIVNDGRAPIMLEASANRISANTDIGVFPPATTIPPGQRQVFRLILPPQVEKTQFWRVRISEVSPREFGQVRGNGQVRNELSFEIPVFRNRPGTQPALVAQSGKIRNQGDRQILITKIGEQAIHRYLLPNETIDARPGARVFSLDREIAVR